MSPKDLGHLNRTPAAEVAIAAPDGIATDLAALWMLFEDEDARQEAIAAYGPISSATLQRAKGWAILFGVVLLDTGLMDYPRQAAIGEQTLRRIAQDGESRS
ncbi:hypothetical protein [Nodosilinea nodulosa]|uniref:hypothetical protein n=1 Tax=Nodosilinea nodulosa TaxID=416001 RepID=UPI00030418F5|nr:hypothetical protein [Nodosilinea nodulosa]